MRAGSTGHTPSRSIAATMWSLSRRFCAVSVPPLAIGVRRICARSCLGFIVAAPCVVSRDGVGSRLNPLITPCPFQDRLQG
jgi:hypothetical protein